VKGSITIGEEECSV